MTPAFLWTAWTAVYGAQQPPPRALVILPLIICPLLYWVFFQWGRRSLKETQTEVQKSLNLQSDIHTTVEPVPVRPIEPTEETQLRNCFPWSVYYLQNIEYRAQAVICRGQLRTTPTNAYQQIKANIEAHCNSFGPNRRPMVMTSNKSGFS
ncbi:hypothetical protein NUACC21_77550 [Scytonema sp. NUACC21]